MKLELVNDGKLEYINMYRVCYYSKKFGKVTRTPFFSAEKKAIEHYLSMCKMGLYEYDADYYISEQYLY